MSIGIFRTFNTIADCRNIVPNHPAKKMLDRTQSLLFLLANALAVPAAVGQDSRACGVTLSIVETSHVGVMDLALRDLLFGDGTISSGGTLGPILKFIVPDGRLPDDLLFSWDPQPGVSLGLKAQPGGDFGGIAIEGNLLFDRNRFAMVAPTGFGILTDPTTITTTVDLFALSALASMPVMAGSVGEARVVASVGVGATAYYSVSRLSARSDFLEVDETTVQQRLAPVASATLEILPTQVSGDAFGVELGLLVFPTDDFLTGVVNAGVSVPF